MKVITEKLSTPINYNADVVVAGGGVAGIAAALAAQRQGASVILLERSFALGGLATSGLVTIYLPICDGMGRQVSFGLAEELLRLSIEHGAEDRYPTAWLEGGDFAARRDGQRFLVQFNPSLFAISAEQLLVREGVKIIYGATLVSASVSDGRIDAVIIESKSGREAIAVNKCAIDATGDADLAHLAGADTRKYAHGNTLAAWYYYFTDGKYDLKQFGFTDVDLRKSLKMQGANLGTRIYHGLTAEDATAMMIDSHAVIERDILERRAAGERDLIPTAIASIPQFRMTRGVVGLSDTDVTDNGRHQPDSVGVYSNWRLRGPVYELPFGSIVSRNIRNLLSAGRCISSTDDMWDIVRVIPVCAVSGEAAGVAAAMCDDLLSLDVSALQSKLRECGVKIHIDEI